MIEARCGVCGNPLVDHVPLRYPLRAWFWHRVHRLIERVVSAPLSRIADTSDGL